MKIEINNLQKDVKFEEQFIEILESIAREVATREGLEARTVSLALVNDEKIAALNQEYRNKTGKTDVLSFPLDDNQLLGDIAISLPTAKEQAQEYGHSLKRELGFLFLHGLLHLVGYSHYDSQARKAMRAKEESILNDLGLER